MKCAKDFDSLHVRTVSGLVKENDIKKYVLKIESRNAIKSKTKKKFSDTLHFFPSENERQKQKYIFTKITRKSLLYYAFFFLAQSERIFKAEVRAIFTQNYHGKYSQHFHLLSFSFCFSLSLPYRSRPCSCSTSA